MQRTKIYILSSKHPSNSGDLLKICLVAANSKFSASKIRIKICTFVWPEGSCTGFSHKCQNYAYSLFPFSRLTTQFTFRGASTTSLLSTTSELTTVYGCCQSNKKLDNCQNQQYSTESCLSCARSAAIITIITTITTIVTRIITIIAYVAPFPRAPSIIENAKLKKRSKLVDQILITIDNNSIIGKHCKTKKSSIQTKNKQRAEYDGRCNFVYTVLVLLSRYKVVG